MKVGIIPLSDVRKFQRQVHDVLYTTLGELTRSVVNLHNFGDKSGGSFHP